MGRASRTTDGTADGDVADGDGIDVIDVTDQVNVVDLRDRPPAAPVARDPEDEHARWVLPLLVALLVAFWVVGTVATALTPALLRDHPLALVALEPRNRNLLLTAGKVDAAPFVVLAVLRRISSDPVYFALGFLYGPSTLRWLERRSGRLGGQFIRWVERIFPGVARPLVFLFPGLLVCLLAGVTRMRLRTFLAWNLAGTIAIVCALRLFAERLGGPLGAINDWNDRYATTLTYLTIGLVAVYLVWQRRSGSSELETVRELRQEINRGRVG